MASGEPFEHRLGADLGALGMGRPPRTVDHAGVEDEPYEEGHQEGHRGRRHGCDVRTGDQQRQDMQTNNGLYVVEGDGLGEPRQLPATLVAEVA